MRNLSAELKVWKDSQSRLIPLISLYEIEVSDSETLRLVAGDPDGTGSVTYGGDVYNACAIDREEHTENIEGDFPSFQLLVSNVNGVAGGYIERNDLDGRQVTIRTGLLRGNEADYQVETYTIAQANYNRKQAVLTLGPPNFFSKKTNPKRFQRLRCQHPWAQRFLDDAECGYPSDTFEADSEQDMLPGSTTNSEQVRQFGWHTINALKCTRLNVLDDVMSIASANDDVEWEPDFLNAPFCYKKLGGDFDVFTEVLVQMTRVGFFAGLLCQDNEGTPSSWVYFGQAIDQNGEQQVRAAAAESGVLKQPLQFQSDVHKWVRLTRVGNNFTCRYSSDTATWMELGVQTVAMGGDVRLGLCLSAPRQEKGEIWASFGILQFRAGGEFDCERTREACRLKGNIHRYGAHPGIPKIR